MVHGVILPPTLVLSSCTDNIVVYVWVCIVQYIKYSLNKGHLEDIESVLYSCSEVVYIIHYQYICMRQNQVSSIERCPLFKGSFYGFAVRTCTSCIAR